MNSCAEILDFSAARKRRSNRMENQKQGYVPLYRSILKQPWAKDVYLRTLWENLLLNAARKPYLASFKGHSWQLEAGQLVTTSADLGLALCDRNGEPTSRHSVERMLAVFEKEGMISVRAERRKGTLISIINYSEYAQKNGDSPAHNSAHIHAHIEPSNHEASEYGAAHNSEHIPAHHEQEGFNKNKNNTQTHEVGLSGEEKLTPRQKGTNPRARKTNPRSQLPEFDRERFKSTWNCKAEKYGIPTIRSITATTEAGIKRLWQSYLKQCKELNREPKDPDTILNGYIEHGYTPTRWSCGENPDGKKYGIDTALRQEKIDQILGADS